MSTDYLTVTELAGDQVSQEQVERMSHRYWWASELSRGKVVLEAACGTGQGLGLLGDVASALFAGDFSLPMLRIAGRHYGRGARLVQLDAQRLPFAQHSLDVVILLEALYYLPSAASFVAECRRVLRAGGKVLTATANKDLFDFSPSAFSHTYYGVVELHQLFYDHGFSVECFGAWPVRQVSLRQRLTRPIKKAAVRLRLIPRTMAGKKWLKRLVFGRLVDMPPELRSGNGASHLPVPLPAAVPDRLHKVIYCAATLDGADFNRKDPGR